MQKTFQNLVKNFRKFFNETGAKKVILGISGGVDSAVCAKILVDSVGAEKVFGILMPHKNFSSAENLNDARELAENLKIEFREIEISKFCAPFFATEFAGKNLVRANLMARVRANLLFAAANFFGGIVAGTCNRTEIEIGFFTKFGDGAADFEIIGKLFKTEVFSIARFLNLEKFAAKKPTAELFENHFDETEIGVSYEKIDEILQRIFNEKNFAPQNSDEKKVWKLFQNSAHKREVPPVISREEI
jgi:NAD+ synthase